MKCKRNKYIKHSICQRVLKIRKSTTQLPYIIDDCDDNTYIVSLFYTTYSDLYNSVSTPVHIVDSLYSKINRVILDSHETRQPHVTNCDVRTAMKGPKSDKSEGSTDLTSDSIINGTDVLFKCISNVFTIMLQHDYAPTHFMMSTIIPILRRMKSNLKCSENYRPIDISSLLGKVFGKIIISQQHDFLFSSSYQFGFKRHSSTVL